MKIFDLGIAYKWIYDIDFVERIEKFSQSNGISTFLISTHNIDSMLSSLQLGEIEFRFVLDRASDEDEHFQPFADFVSNSKSQIINDYTKIDDAIDKSIMHTKLLSRRIRIPKTLIVPPLDDEPEIKIQENTLDQIGIPFIIKPSYYSGGSEGVKLNAASIDDIKKSRKTNTDDSYLIQKKIEVANIENRRAWFRVFSFWGEIFITWWDDLTHRYTNFILGEIDSQYSDEIKETMAVIKEIAKLDYFSSEFCLDKNMKLYLIDYVNDQCDFRCKTDHVDGVPEEIIDKFISLTIEQIKK